MNRPTRTPVRDEALTRTSSRSVSPYYAAHEVRPRRACPTCHRWFVASTRTQEACSFACAVGGAAHV